MFDRLAGAWAYWGWKGGYFSTEADARAYYDEMRYMLAAQMGAPNSPQWFNTGLHWAYGIDGPGQGHFYVDFQSGELVKSTSAYEHPQPHACFIQSVADDLVNEGGIMDLWTREARLFKYGSGTGTNFSSLRGENERLAGGGKSSGLMSFLKIGDRAAGAIKSGGTTRRAAKMVICDMDHPDIEDFINWKVVEEQKVAAPRRRSQDPPRAAGGDPRRDPGVGRRRGRRLRPEGQPRPEGGDPGGEEGCTCPRPTSSACCNRPSRASTEIDFRTYDTDWDSDAYLTVSGQNSNNSVRVTDAFLQAVRDDADWELTRRTDGKVAKVVKARELWEQIGHAAWACADPGRAVPRHHQRLAHLPGGRADPGVEPLLGVHVPRRHRLQPRVDEPADLPPGRPVRRQGLRACHPALDGDARDLGADGAVPERAHRRALLPLPHARARLRQHRRAADDHGARLRLGARAGRSAAR